MKSSGRKITNILKMLSADMTKNKNCEYAIDCAEIMYNLFANNMIFNPADPTWINRDRILIGVKDISPLYYATLSMFGYDITIDDLKRYDEFDPEVGQNLKKNVSKGIENSFFCPSETLKNAVGMAFSEKLLSNRVNTKQKEIINYNTYVIMKSEDLENDEVDEALKFAGLYNLSELIIIATVEKNISKEKKEALQTRLDGYNILTYNSSINSFSRTVENANGKKHPAVIFVEIGKDKDKDKDSLDLEELRKKLDVCSIPFEILKSDKDYITNILNKRAIYEYNLWQKDYDEYKSIKSVGSEILLDVERIIHFDSERYKLSPSYEANLFKSINDIISIIQNKTTSFIVGITLYNDYLKNSKTLKMISNEEFSGNLIDFRNYPNVESGILNGLSLTGFSVLEINDLDNNMKSIKSLNHSHKMNLNHLCILLNNHDSELPYLNNFYNLDIMCYRPADINELFGAMENITKFPQTCVIVIDNDRLMKLDSTVAKYVTYGGYIVKKEIGKADAIIMASGRELEKALLISNKLYDEEINTRVVSIPEIISFNKQSINYKKLLLPSTSPIFILDEFQDYYWLKYVNLNEFMLNTRKMTDKEIIKYIKEKL